jgi:hypothetical protein
MGRCARSTSKIQRAVSFHVDQTVDGVTCTVFCSLQTDDQRQAVGSLQKVHGVVFLRNNACASTQHAILAKPLQSLVRVGWFDCVMNKLGTDFTSQCAPRYGLRALRQPLSDDPTKTLTLSVLTFACERTPGGARPRRVPITCSWRLFFRACGSADQLGEDPVWWSRSGLVTRCNHAQLLE